MRNMPKTNKLFQCHVNQMSQLGNGLTTKTLLTGAFLEKFLFGQGVPIGLPTQQNWKHFSLYYDGQFDDPLFIAHGFNQLQRTYCIRNSARITGKNLATLKSLGVLATSEEF